MVAGAIKTLIISANGMLGSDLCKVFPDAVKLTHKDLDITNRTQVINCIQDIKLHSRYKTDVVINAAAYTNVDDCEDNKELVFQVNEYGPGYIAEACTKVGAIFVHFSTDYVFDDSKTENIEYDITNPINVYGHSKLLGEKTIVENMNDYRIIRISWLFGIHGKNFVETMLELSKEIDTIQVINDQFGKPTYTIDLANKIKLRAATPP